MLQSLLFCVTFLLNAAETATEVLDRILPKPAVQGPILIAHRGGVVTPESPEGSAAAIQGAAAAGFAMVELDLQPTRDHQPFVFHDRSLDKALGIPGSLSDHSATEAGALRFAANGAPLLSLREALSLCRDLELGVMLDIKRGEDPEFFAHIRDALRDTGYLGRVLCINRAPAILTHLEGAVYFRVDDADVAAPPEGVYWFGLPEHLPDGRVAALRAAGILVIPAINTFRYDAATHWQDAQADIQRLTRARVDGFQIDSVYLPHFVEAAAPATQE